MNSGVVWKIDMGQSSENFCGGMRLSDRFAKKNYSCFLGTKLKT